MSLKKTGKILLAIGLFVCSTAIQAQSYDQGRSVITAGYGFPDLHKTLLKKILEIKQDDIEQSHHDDIGDVTHNVKGYGPVFLKYEYGLSKLIGLGASFGYSDTKYNQTYSYGQRVYDPDAGMYNDVTYRDITKYHFSSFSAGARLNFHFATTEKLDLYAGIAAGYTRLTYTYTFESTNPGRISSPLNYTGFPLYFALSAGGRYYFTKNLGAYAEVGIDKLSLIQAGLAIKF